MTSLSSNMSTKPKSPSRLSSSYSRESTSWSGTAKHLVFLIDRAIKRSSNLPQMEPWEVICIPGRWPFAHSIRSGSTDGCWLRGNITGTIGGGRNEKAFVGISSLNKQIKIAYLRLGTYHSHVSRWQNRRTRRLRSGTFDLKACKGSSGSRIGTNMIRVRTLQGSLCRQLGSRRWRARWWIHGLGNHQRNDRNISW